MALDPDHIDYKFIPLVIGVCNRVLLHVGNVKKTRGLAAGAVVKKKLAGAKAAIKHTKVDNNNNAAATSESLNGPSRSHKHTRSPEDAKESKRKCKQKHVSHSVISDLEDLDTINVDKSCNKKKDKGKGKVRQQDPNSQETVPNKPRRKKEYMGKFIGHLCRIRWY